MEVDNSEGRNYGCVYAPTGKQRSNTETEEAGRSGDGKVQTPELTTSLRKQKDMTKTETEGLACDQKNALSQNEEKKEGRVRAHTRPFRGS